MIIHDLFMNQETPYEFIHESRNYYETNYEHEKLTHFIH